MAPDDAVVSLAKIDRHKNLALGPLPSAPEHHVEDLGDIGASVLLLDEARLVGADSGQIAI